MLAHIIHSYHLKKFQVNLGDYAKKAVSFLARNFYTLKYVALVLAFCINFVLLFYKVRVTVGVMGEVQLFSPECVS